MMKILIIVFGAALLATGCSHRVRPEDKAAFLKLMKELPVQGEFFTEASVDKAAHSTDVLLSLTSADIARQDLYPFLALSRGLCERNAPRHYAVQHFAEIAHPEIQMFWAAILFDKGEASDQIVQYLDSTLKSADGAKRLANILGPDFIGFQERVRNAPRHGA